MQIPKLQISSMCRDSADLMSIKQPNLGIADELVKGQSSIQNLAYRQSARCLLPKADVVSASLHAFAIHSQHPASLHRMQFLLVRPATASNIPQTHSCSDTPPASCKHGPCWKCSFQQASLPDVSLPQLKCMQPSIHRGHQGCPLTALQPAACTSVLKA